MSLESSKNKNSGETRKKILLGILFVVLVGVIYYQFFTGEEEIPARPVAAAANTTRVVTAIPTRPQGPDNQKPEKIITQPLDLASITGKVASGAGSGRNIFIYPPPPPPPPPKPQPTLPPPPPPPITLYSVNPSGIIARTGDFTLTVFGDKFPQDIRVFLDGREFPTVLASGTEAKASIPADAIKRAGNLGVQVRSRNDVSMYSNQLSLNIAEPPPPPYRFIGLIVSSKATVAVLKSISGEEVINVTKGDKIGKNWRVVNITPQKIEIEDTNLKIMHAVNFTGENG